MTSRTTRKPAPERGGAPRSIVLLTRWQARLLALVPLAFLGAFLLGEMAVMLLLSVVFPVVFAVQAFLPQAGHALSLAAPAATAQPDADRAPPPGDALTGAASRTEALARLTRILEDTRTSGMVSAVFHIDIDGFQRMNERYGLEAGDTVLKAIALRLRATMRERDMIARLDGDSFAVILAPVRRADAEGLSTIATRILKKIAEAVAIDGASLYVTACIGVCHTQRAPKRDPASVLASAEAACLAARQMGPGSVRSFSPRMRRDAQKLSSLSIEVEAALEAGQVKPWFQPQVDTTTGAVRGFEALARWEHPDHGVILPGMFLKAIEAAGKTERLTEVILFRSLSALRSWDDAGLHVPNIGVNFSTDQLRNPQLVEKLKWDLDRFELSPDRIVIEVLETVFAEHDDEFLPRNIRALAEHGFAIDLDDFGTGHASIANIRRFAVSRIKIDRSFVTNLDEDVTQRRLIQGILHLAQGLGLETLAEGVETIAEQRTLAAMGCGVVQGYGIARPMPFEDATAWLHRQARNRVGGTVAAQGLAGAAE